MPKGLPDSERSILRWVFENIALTPSKEEAPTPGAFMFLMFVKRDNDSLREFYRQWMVSAFKVEEDSQKERVVRDAVEVLATDVEEALTRLERLEQGGSEKRRRKPAVAEQPAADVAG